MSNNAQSINSARLYWLHAITPMHIGSGRGSDFIDLPIMRERVTGWPMAPGSSIKGVWRYYAESRRVDKDLQNTTFGLTGKDDDHSGSLSITDAHLVLFPARSLYGTFAYATSLMALRRLARELEVIGILSKPEMPVAVETGEALISESSVLTDVDGENRRVYFDDLDFQARQDARVDQWANWLGSSLFPDPKDEQHRRLLTQRLVIVDDNCFNQLTEQGTEVNARVRIDSNSKTVANGALWYEECLPAESVLAGIVWCDRVYGVDLTPDELLERLFPAPFICRVGGKATVGKGLARSLFMAKEG